MLKYGRTNAFFNRIEQRIPNTIFKVCYDMNFHFDMLNTFMMRLILFFLWNFFCYFILYIYWKNMFSHNKMEKNSYNLLLLWNKKKKKVHFSIWGWYMCISKHQSFHLLVLGSWEWDYLMFNLTKPKVNLTTQDLISKNILIHKKD